MEANADGFQTDGVQWDAARDAEQDMGPDLRLNLAFNSNKKTKIDPQNLNLLPLWTGSWKKQKTSTQFELLKVIQSCTAEELF